MIKDKLNVYRQMALQGDFPFLPCTVDFLQPYIPCYLPDIISIVSGSSSSGKSSLTKYMMFKAIEYAIDFKKDLKIIWVALEETPEQFEYSVLSYLLYKHYGVELSMMDLMSMSYESGRRYVLEEKVINYIDQLNPLVDLYMSYFHFTTLCTSYGIYSYIRDIASENGKFFNGDKEVKIEPGIAENSQPKFDRYVKENSTTFLAVIDHISLLRPTRAEEGEKGLYNAIGNLRHYCNTIVTKLFRIHCCFIQQQTKGQESLTNVQHSYYFPSALGLDSNKSTFNDCRVFIGISSPKHFGVTSWKINKLKNGMNMPEQKNFSDLESEFRVINIAKNTFGRTLNATNEMVPLNFYAKALSFKQLL